MKEKLTLSVNKEVVDKAKKLGINISNITEKVLTGYTTAEKPKGNLHDAYQKLFDSILPLLKEFDCQINIGKGYDIYAHTGKNGEIYEQEIPLEFYYTSDGDFWVDTYDTTFKDIKKISSRYFLSPEEILSNLVNSLAKSNEKRKEKINAIFMAKKIIDAMSENLLSNVGEQDEKG